MPDEFSYFQTGSGLPLEGATVQVIQEEATIDNSYAAGAVVVKLTFQPYDADNNPAGDAQSQLYSIGKNWEILDRGAAVGHTSGKPVRFNNQSTYGRLIDACFAPESHLGGKDALIAECVARQLEPNTMAMWHGMWFVLGSLKFPKMGETMETATGSTMVPVAYLGATEVEGEGAGSVSQTQVAAAPAGVAARPAPRPAAPAPAAPAAPSAPAAAGRTMPPRPGATSAAPAASATPPAAPAPAAAAAKKASAPKAPAAPKPPAAPTQSPAQKLFSVDGDGTAHVEGVDDMTVYNVVVKATEHNDFEAFMVDAMSIEGVAGNANMEQALMGQGEGTLWGTYHG